MEPVTNVEEAAAVELGALLDAGAGATVTLVAGDTQLVAHRAVLATRGPALLHSAVEAQAGSDRVTVTGIGGPALRQLVARSYTLEAPHLPGETPRLLPAASECGATESKAAETAAVDLGTLLDAGHRAVVTLVAGDTRLAAHRAVVAARSSVLGSRLCPDTPEGAGVVVTLSDVEGPVLRQLLAYCYSGRTPHLPGAAAQLLAAADACGVSGLKVDCERQLAAGLTLQNAAAAAVLAVAHCCPVLTPAAVTFIRDNLQVLATRGWADAVLRRPRHLLAVSRLLAEPPPENQSRPWEERGRRLMQVADAGVLEELEALLAVGADVRTTDWEGWTALHFAANMGRAEAVRALLAAGAEVDAQTDSEFTALHLAAGGGHAEVVRLLLAAGADLSARDWGDYTPLHSAGHNYHMVALLLEAGADRNAKDCEGDTPIGLAGS